MRSAAAKAKTDSPHIYSLMTFQAQTLKVDPCCCPLCGQPNACAMAAPVAATVAKTGAASEAADRAESVVAAEPCWCTRVHFSADLLNQVPQTARNRACICAACVAVSQDKSEVQPKGTPQGEGA